MPPMRLLCCCLAGVLSSCAPVLCQVRKGVISAPWDFRADTSVTVIKEALEEGRSAVEAVSGERDGEVLTSATRCASALFQELHVHNTPARVARFASRASAARGDSWTFDWPGARCPESAVCLTRLTDTPGNTMMEVRLPSGDLNRVLDQSLRWATAPIHLGNMHVYSNVIGMGGSPVALLGGVPGSEWLGGFGFQGAIETVEDIRTMRVLLGKRHCNEFYPKDLYFSSRRFRNLSTEAKKMGLVALVADIKNVLGSHRYALPATELEILLSELANREPTTEIVRDLIHTAMWPLDGHSRYRMHYLTDQFFRSPDSARRNLGALSLEMTTFLGSYHHASVRGRVPSHVTGIAENIFKFFRWREDDVSIEDMALLFARDPHFTQTALFYLAGKGSEKAAEALRRTPMPPELEAARDLTVQKIAERLSRRSERQ